MAAVAASTDDPDDRRPGRATTRTTDDPDDRRFRRSG
jgi:hypothetical protein